MEESENNQNSALKVNEGINQPPSINADALKKIKQKRHKLHSTEFYVDGILKGDRTILSRVITLLESSHQRHYVTSQKIIEKCLPHSAKSIRIGITGIPGVGKSTFIEAFGKYLTSLGRKVAVLAIDPSSKKTKGCILGDKTRMEELANDPNAYIRPTLSAGTLGGVA
ncbi:MAG: ATP/GTP-binding protein, partial [Bacteroidales bacterium]|nr:ATP/GTP-binding protein [Bacteroidales bacterium]